MKELKKAFLEGMEIEIQEAARRRAELEAHAHQKWEAGEIPADTEDLLRDNAEQEERQQLRFLWNLCIDRGCAEEDLEEIFPEC